MRGPGTTTITAVLVDDEPLACDELSYLLKDFPDIEIAATGHNGVEAVELIERLAPDLVFLDVQMPGLDGMGVIRRLEERGVELPHFVLATGYEQYAVEAFRVAALDYLLKPIDKQRLAVTIDRVREAMQGRGEPDYTSAQAAPQRTKLLIRSGGRSFIVDAQDLVYATIEDGVITMATTTVEGGSNYRTIEELQSNLDPDVFWRVHRSYLVNINRIKEVIPWFKSSYQLRMDDKKQTEVPVSRVQTKRLRALLKL